MPRGPNSGLTIARRRRMNRHLTLVVGLALERAIEARRRHFQARVVALFDLEHVLELARDEFAVVDRHGFGFAGRVGSARHAIDHDAQQPASRAFEIDQLVTETGDGDIDGLLPGHDEEKT